MLITYMSQKTPVKCYNSTLVQLPLLSLKPTFFICAILPGWTPKVETIHVHTRVHHRNFL